MADISKIQAGGVVYDIVAGKLVPGKNIDGVLFNGTADIIHFGVCGTAANQAAKTVACTGYSLDTGSRIIVKFTNGNTAASPTLSVNSTTAKAIQYRGSALTSTNGNFAAGSTFEFIYDGTAYQLVGDTVTALNGSITGSAGAGKTLTAFSQTDGIVSATFGDIAVNANQVAGTASTAAYFDSNGKLASHPSVTATELGYLDGATSNIQDQINAITGGGIDKVRFCKVEFTSSTLTFTNADILGGKTVSVDDVIVGKNGTVCEVVTVTSSGGTVTILGTLKTTLTYSYVNSDTLVLPSDGAIDTTYPT